MLYRSERGGRDCVTACSAPANQLGIEVGMPLVEARSLLRIHKAQSQVAVGESLAPPWFIDHDMAADRAVLMEIAPACHRFAPRVGIEDADVPESLLLDVTGVADWFGGEDALEEEIRQELAGRDLHFRAAFADTIGAAWAVAHFGCDRETSIRALPVIALRLPDETVELLERLGIRQIGQLVRLPRSELRSRFGPRLLERIDQAAGAMEEVLVDLPPREAPTAEATLEFPTDRYERIDRVLGQLIERVLETLSAQSHGVLELVCRFECQDARTVVTTVGLFQPSRSADHLQELVRLQRPWNRCGGPVGRLRVLVTRSARFDHCQKRLFDDDGLVPDSRRFATLIDRLNGRLGQSAVVRVQPLPDAQPERAWSPVPLVACEETRSAATKKALRSKRGSSRSSSGKSVGKGRCRKDGSSQTEDDRLSMATGLHRPPSLLPVPMFVDQMMVAFDGTPHRFRWPG
ncbi:MAG: DNA polymerase Y family protein, partial [Pirellulales bacterium]